MKKEITWKYILIISLILVTISISGCSSPEKYYESDKISFKVPANWAVDETQYSNELAILRPIYTKYPAIYIHSSEFGPDEILDSYITNYPYEYPRFEVVTREPVEVNGHEGEKLVFKNTEQNDFLLIGPDYYSSVVVFQDNNKTYIITTSEALENIYNSQVEPAVNTLLDSITIKE